MSSFFNPSSKDLLAVLIRFANLDFTGSLLESSCLIYSSHSVTVGFLNSLLSPSGRRHFRSSSSFLPLQIHPLSLLQAIYALSPPSSPTVPPDGPFFDLALSNKKGGLKTRSRFFFHLSVLDQIHVERNLLSAAFIETLHAFFFSL